MKRSPLHCCSEFSQVAFGLLFLVIVLSSSISTAADNDSGELTREAVARELALVHNHPNPFNAHTTIYYNLLRPSHVRVDIYDLAGRWVDTIWDGHQAEGENFAVWKTDVDPSGTYIYCLTVDGIVVTKKMSLVK